MAKRKESPADRLAALPMSRGGRTRDRWLLILPPGHQEEIMEIRAGWIDGRYAHLSCTQVMDFIRTEFGATVSDMTLRRWLKTKVA